MKQKYRSIWEFKRIHGLCWPTKEEWRLLKPKLGSIEALPRTRGVVVATNGILCYIELENGTLFLGHLEHFNIEKTEREFKSKTPKAPKETREERNLRLAQEYA
jgi:hypothetical protein